MSWVAVGSAAAAVGSSLLSSRAQKKAAGQASDAQVQAAEIGIEEQRRQFDAIQKLLEPFVTAGTGAVGGQQALAGLSGDAAQRSAIGALERSPEFAALTRQGEEAILANASATGGLRGGDTQAALAQFRPAILSQLIERQFGRLGGIAGMGQASAAGVGAAGLQTGQGISGLMQQVGAAQAGNALAAGQANVGLYNNIGQAISQIGGMYAARNAGGGAIGNELF